MEPPTCKQNSTISQSKKFEDVKKIPSEAITITVEKGGLPPKESQNRATEGINRGTSRSYMCIYLFMFLLSVLIFKQHRALVEQKQIETELREKLQNLTSIESYISSSASATDNDESDWEYDIDQELSDLEQIPVTLVTYKDPNNNRDRSLFCETSHRKSYRLTLNREGPTILEMADSETSMEVEQGSKPSGGATANDRTLTAIPELRRCWLKEEAAFGWPNEKRGENLDTQKDKAGPIIDIQDDDDFISSVDSDKHGNWEIESWESEEIGSGSGFQNEEKTSGLVTRPLPSSEPASGTTERTAGSTDSAVSTNSRNYSSDHLLFVADELLGLRYKRLLNDLIAPVSGLLPIWKRVDNKTSFVENIVSNASVVIRKAGLYRISAQLAYKFLKSRHMEFSIAVNSAERIKCRIVRGYSVYGENGFRSGSSWGPDRDYDNQFYHPCLTALTVHLTMFDVVEIHCKKGCRGIVYDPVLTYWGIELIKSV